MAMQGGIGMNAETCEIDQDVISKSESLKMSKAKCNEAIIVKIITNENLLVIEEELNDVTIEEVAEELPERQPRYVLYSYVYKHNDGRVSYPYMLIYYSPIGCSPVQQMQYASSKIMLARNVKATKTFDIREKEEMTEEWLLSKLAFFK